MKKSITSYHAQMLVINGIEARTPLDSIVKQLSQFDFDFNEERGPKLSLKQWVINEMSQILFQPEEYNLKLQLPRAA